MKKVPASLLFFFMLLQVSLAQKPITLEDCFVYYKFYPQGAANFSYLQDGVRYVENEEGSLHFHDVRRSDADSVLRLQLPETAQDFQGFTFSKDESQLLLRTATEPVYRHSVLANYFIYDLASRQTTPVFEGAKQQFAEFSPSGAHIAFVAGNNLYVKDLASGKTSQITRDDEKNSIINGLPDWVYEEEFSPVGGDGMVATKWSPDGKQLAFLRFDERKVPQFPLTWYEGGGYPRYSAFKYPKVGAPNSVVSVHMYDVEAGSLLGQVMGPEQDDYVPRLHWTVDNQLIVSRLNRRQDTLELLVALPGRRLYDADDKINWIPSRLLLRETDPAYVEIHDNLIFLKDRQRYLWTSEKSGFNRLYVHTLNGTAPPLPLTTGNYDLTAFYGLDEKNGKFYYQTASPTPLDRQLWEGQLSGGEPRLLSPLPGTNDAAFSPSFDYFTHTWSDANTPTVVTLRNRQGEVLRTLADNQRIRQLRTEYGFANKEFFTFPLADGTVLNGWMLKPVRFDSSRHYPVLFDNYGGPGSQTVLNQYDGYLGSWHQLLSQKGVIIVSVDNRGTGGRGSQFKKVTQLQLGKLETEDQIAAARYLGTLPYVDPARIGIWGWSFGGYLSTSCILKGPEVFKMAMAVAPVTNWKWYDSAYTERYMHTTADNSTGYESNSPVNFANRLRGDNYLICHGVADDNVHWQQTTEMINALVKANKQFETYYYPNRNHGIYGENATRHLFTKLTNFVLEKL